MFNAFTVREAVLRGMLATGRATEVVRLAEGFPVNEGTPPTPQWRVIEGITTAEVLASAGDHKAASSMLTSAIGYAEELRLSHQAQRITLLAAQLAQAEIAAVGPHAADALSRINAWLAGNDPAVPHLT